MFKRTQIFLQLGMLIMVAQLIGCATTPSKNITDVQLSINSISEAVVQALPLGKRQVSPNGREFLSNYFTVGNRTFKPAGKSPSRYYAHITILGDRRPYDISIVVHRERRTLNSQNREEFENIGWDDGLANVVATRVRERLAKRREDRNFIDDFRVF